MVGGGGGAAGLGAVMRADAAHEAGRVVRGDALRVCDCRLGRWVGVTRGFSGYVVGKQAWGERTRRGWYCAHGHALGKPDVYIISGGIFESGQKRCALVKASPPVRGCAYRASLVP